MCFRRMTVVLTLATIASSVVFCPMVAAQQDEAQALAAGLQLFEAGQYQDAQEILLVIDVGQLDANQNKARVDALGEIRVARTLSEKAFRELECGGLAVD